jgi:hypothetical protein
MVRVANATPAVLLLGITRYTFYVMLGGPRGRSGGRVREISPAVGIGHLDGSVRGESLH